jgi:hypothetical protein
LLVFGLAFSSGCGRVGYDSFRDETHRIASGSGTDGSVDDPSASSGGAATNGNGGAGNGATGNGGGTGGGNQSGGTTAAGGATTAQGGTKADAGGSASTDAGPGTGNDGGGGTAGTGAGGTAGTGAGGATNTGGSGGACTVTNAGVEACDGVDNDCNMVVDEGAVCGTNCTGATYGGHAYAFCSTPLTFVDAVAACGTKSMRLSRIDDANENGFLAGVAFAAVGSQNTPSIWPWFGASDSATPVQWSFQDGAVFWTGKNNGAAVGGLYSNWAAASPTDATGTYCATLSHSGALNWVDRNCTNTHPYLCEAY